MKRMSDISEGNVKIVDLHEIISNSETPWPDELAISEELREKIVFKHFEGPLFFGMTREFKTVMNSFEDLHLLCLRLEKVPFIDQSGLHALRAAIEELQAKDVVVVISGANKGVVRSLSLAGIVPDVLDLHHVFTTFNDAKSWLISILHDEQGLEKELAKLKQLGTK